MRYLLILLLYISLILPLSANIDAQIEAIQRASVSERFKLMNAFKRDIVQMKETERIEALTKLRSINNSKHADSAFREITRHKPRRYSKHREEILERDKEGDVEDNVANQTENSVENETSNETEDTVENETNNETEDSVENETSNETENSVENETSNETENNVENETSNETENNIEIETQEHIENETADRNEEEHDDD